MTREDYIPAGDGGQGSNKSATRRWICGGWDGAAKVRQRERRAVRRDRMKENEDLRV